MRHHIALLIASAALAACGQSEAPKTPPPPAPKTDMKPASDTKPADAKVEEKPHAAESHGMPGMSDLVKVDDDKKAEPKKDEPKK